MATLFTPAPSCDHHIIMSIFILLFLSSFLFSFLLLIIISILASDCVILEYVAALHRIRNEAKKNSLSWAIPKVVFIVNHGSLRYRSLATTLRRRIRSRHLLCPFSVASARIFQFPYQMDAQCYHYTILNIYHMQ